jgi:hypothetical protein
MKQNEQFLVKGRKIDDFTITLITIKQKDHLSQCH